MTEPKDGYTSINDSGDTGVIGIKCRRGYKVGIDYEGNILQ